MLKTSENVQPPKWKLCEQVSQPQSELFHHSLLIPSLSFAFEELHKERLQSFIFGGSQDALENFIIEEELELQLALLQDQTGNESTLFPAEIDSSIPHLNDPLSHEPNPVNVNKNESVLHAPTPMQVLALEESLLEENTMETILICLIAAAFIFMPQILT